MVSALFLVRDTLPVKEPELRVVFQYSVWYIVERVASTVAPAATSVSKASTVTIVEEAADAARVNGK